MGIYETLKDYTYKIVAQVEKRLLLYLAITISGVIVFVCSAVYAKGNGIYNAPRDIDRVIKNDSTQFRIIRTNITTLFENQQTIVDNQEIQNTKQDQSITNQDSLIYLVNLLLQKQRFSDEKDVLFQKSIDQLNQSVNRNTGRIDYLINK